jgi:hypothetical protein
VYTRGIRSMGTHASEVPSLRSLAMLAGDAGENARPRPPRQPWPHFYRNYEKAARSDLRLEFGTCRGLRCLRHPPSRPSLFVPRRTCLDLPCQRAPIKRDTQTMHSSIAVAMFAAWSIGLLSPGAMNASAEVKTNNNLRAEHVIFRGSNLAAPDLPRAGQNPQTEKGELLAAIVSARISDPDRVAGVLNDLRVESTSHLGRLDLEEWSEMMAEMRGGGVALGTRNKLRLLVAAESSRSRTESATLSGGLRRIQTGSDDEESSLRSGRQAGASTSTAKQASEEREPSNKSTGTIFGVSGDSAPHVPAPSVDCASVP